MQYQNKNGWLSSILLKRATFRPFLVQWLTLISGASSPQRKLTRLFHAWFVSSCIICCPTWSVLCSSPSPTLSRFTIFTLREWFSGRILACQMGDRCSIPHSCIWLLAVRSRRARFTFSSSDLERAWQQELGWTAALPKCLSATEFCD